MTPYSSALKRLCEDLTLPLPDAFSQEWVHELPESYRTVDWLDRYVAALAHPAYGVEERRILMSLALDVANDLAGAGELTDAAWSAIEGALEENLEEYSSHVEYWSVEGEPLEDCFALTPRVRAFAVSR